MAQVNGRVAVKPWSAFVADESSCTETTYVADAPARADIGVVLKVWLARLARVFVFELLLVILLTTDMAKSSSKFGFG